MRIAQIAPLYEAVPPRLYGGTERVVSYLTETLVDMGHEVTLFASGDSRTAARLVAPCGAALRLNGCAEPLTWHMMLFDMVMRERNAFDILHFHTDYLHFPLMRSCPVPCLTTLHGRLDLPELTPLYRHFHDMPVVSISDAQRIPLPGAAWVGTVHHGLPEGLLRFSPRHDGYLAFVGRISPEKRVDRAIRIAARAGLPLKIAAKIDRQDQDYYETEIRPLLDHPLVEFVGEIGEDCKAAFLGRALALLFPIDWPEPFGLVMIEAMACGTPVIAFPGGSVPEVVDEGLTGFVVRSEADAVAAVARAAALDRRRIHRRFRQRFSARRMAENYLALYRKLSHLGPVPLRPVLSPVA